MNSFTVLSIFVNFLMIEAMDPDLQLCQDLFIDAAVSADDGIDYIFKGDYYWRFDTTLFTVPPGYAQPISERWTDLPTPIDAAFAMDEQSYRLSTVFIKGKRWFLYNKGHQRKSGTTANWPYFPNFPIQAAFNYYNASTPMKDQPIFLIYSTDMFAKYSIQSIDAPNQMASSKAHRVGKFLQFLYDPIAMTNAQTLADYINASAVLTNKKNLILFGAKQYCIADINQEAPQCDKVNSTYQVQTFYGCPRSPRPTSATKRTTASKSVGLTNGLNPNEDLSHTPSNDDPLPQPLLSSSAPFKPVQGSNKGPDDENTGYWKYLIGLFVVIVAIICIISLFYFVIVFRNKSKTNEPNVEHNVKRTESNESLHSAMLRTGSGLTEKKGAETSITKPSIGEQTPDSLEIADKSTALKKAESIDPTIDTKLDDQTTSSMAEADQMIQRIKSKEDFDD